MARGTATLSIASPFDVARALVGQGDYEYGTPLSGLFLRPFDLGDEFPTFTASAPLKPGTIYVAPLSEWIQFVIVRGWTEVSFLARMAVLLASRKALLALSVLGYIPLKLKVPRLGGIVAFSPHGKVVLRGVFGTTATTQIEEWSASMSYDVVGEDLGLMPSTIGETALAAIATAWEAVIEESGTSPTPVFSDITWLTEVCYYRAQADGTSTTGVWERYFLPAPAQGIATNSEMPLQIATVVTLDAGGPRGGRFGRFYLPALSLTPDLGRWPAGAAEGLVENVQTALAAVNTALSTAVADVVELVVASGRGDGENRPVRELRVGRVPDTMRSRRSALNEDYAVEPFQSV